MSKGRTTTKQEQDLEDTKRSNIGTTKQIEEEIEQKTEEDKDISNNGMSDNLHNHQTTHPLFLPPFLIHYKALINLRYTYMNVPKINSNCSFLKFYIKTCKLIVVLK